jgi:outer membrane protein assembly factor BamB
MSEDQTIAVMKNVLDSAPQPSGSWDDVLQGRALVRRRRRLLAVSAVAVVATIAASVIALTVDRGSDRHRGGLAVVTGPVSERFAVVARVAVGVSYAPLASGNGSVFAADWNSGQLLRYNADTLRLTGRLRVGGPLNSVLSLAYGNGSLWALDFSSGDLLRIDPRSLRVIGRTPVDGQPSEVAVGDGSVWLTACCRSDQSANRQLLERVDPTSGKVTGRTTLPGQGQSLQVAVGDAIAVSGETGPIRLVDPRTMTVIRSLPDPGQAPDSLAAVDGQIYSLTLDNAVVRLDIGNGTEPVVLRPSGYNTMADQVQSDNHLTSDGRSLWLSTDRQVLRINPTNGSITAHAAITGVGDINSSHTSTYVSRDHDIDRLAAHP